MTETTDTTTPRPDPSAAKDSLRRTLRRSEKGRRVLVRVGTGTTDTGDAGPPEPVTPPPPVPDDQVVPYWVQVYATWFPLRAECRTHAGGALQHLTVLTGETCEWKGQKRLDAIGVALAAEMSASAALKEVGQRAAQHPSAEHTADLQKAAGAYLRAVGELATALNKAGVDATKHVVKQAKKMQKENFGAFHPDLATGLIFGKQSVLLITAILTALAPVTLGISAGVAALVTVAAKGIESAIVEAKVDTDQATVKKLIGRKVSGDNDWVEHGEKIHGRVDKVHGYAEKGVTALKAVADSHALEGLKAGAEVAEGSLGGVGTVLSFGAFYLDIQKYDTTRQVVDAAPPETIKKLEAAVDAVYAMQSSKILTEPVALLELVSDPSLGQGVRMLLTGGKEGVLYSSGTFIASDPRYRFDIFLDRARTLQEKGEQDVRVNFEEPPTMLAEAGTDFTLRASVNASPPGWPDFQGFFLLEGRLTPEGMLRDFPIEEVPPFCHVPAVNHAQDGKGAGYYDSWTEACKVATLLNARAKTEEGFYNDARHPYWAITALVRKPYGDTGETVETLAHLSGNPRPDDYDLWRDKVDSIRHRGEQDARAGQRTTDDHRGHASG